MSKLKLIYPALLLFLLCAANFVGTAQSPDSLDVAKNEHKIWLETENAKFARMIDSLTESSANKYFKDVLDSQDTFLNCVNIGLFIITFFVSLIVGFGLFTQFQHTGNIRNDIAVLKVEKQEMTNKMEAVDSLIQNFKSEEESILKNLDNKAIEINARFKDQTAQIDLLREEFATKYHGTMEIINEEEQKLTNKIKIFEEKTRIAFHSLHNDLLEFCIEVVQELNSKKNVDAGKTELLKFYERILFEHQTIQNLYTDDLQIVYKNLPYLKERGTAKTLPHLEYLHNRLKSLDSNGDNISSALLKTILEFIPVVKYEIEQRNN